jgi:hypothetical protein
MFSFDVDKGCIPEEDRIPIIFKPTYSEFDERGKPTELKIVVGGKKISFTQTIKRISPQTTGMVARQFKGSMSGSKEAPLMSGRQAAPLKPSAPPALPEGKSEASRTTDSTSARAKGTLNTGSAPHKN